MMTNSDKRADIIQAALELIADRGFHGAPMSAIADKAHVAAGTIYRYFENKDVLINELFLELENNAIGVLLHDYPSGKPVHDQFFHVFGELCRYLISHPLHFRYMEQYFNSPYGISKRRDKLVGKKIDPDGHDTLIGIFQEGISQQILKDLPLIVLSSLAIGPMLYLIRDHTLGFVALDDSLILQITEACWDGIRSSANI
jgi:AcrR family transcriptional regulator